MIGIMIVAFVTIKLTYFHFTKNIAGRFHAPEVILHSTIIYLIMLMIYLSVYKLSSFQTGRSSLRILSVSFVSLVVLDLIIHSDPVKTLVVGFILLSGIVGCAILSFYGNPNLSYLDRFASLLSQFAFFCLISHLSFFEFLPYIRYQVIFHTGLLTLLLINLLLTNPASSNGDA